MPTGLIADIYEGKNMSLRAFALNCARHLGGGYQASDYGNRMLPLDKPQVIDPSGYHSVQLKKAEEDLDFWLHVQQDPETMKDIYDKVIAKHEVENIGHDARMKVVKERYEAMISRVEQWQVPEEYVPLKELMLDQLHTSLKHDYHPEYRPWSEPEPIDEWMERNISMARRDIEYHKAGLEKEKQAIAEINAYVKGLYDLLDEVEPYNKEGWPMSKTKKMEEPGRTYNLTDLDTLNVREKATMPDLSALIPDPLGRLQKMNGTEGYALGVKSVCDRIAMYIEEYKGISAFTSTMAIDNVIALLERIRQEIGANNIKV